jgi:hypothetical protein
MNYLKYFSYFLTPAFKEKLSKAVLYVAIISFLGHLGLYILHQYVWAGPSDKLFSSPINALYTPFSFLLVFEAFLLLYYLPKSTSIYIGKQYEIITLILIRGIFKDITHLPLLQAWPDQGEYSKLLGDLITVVLVFLLIYVFYKLCKRFRPLHENAEEPEIQSVQRFIRAKKIITVLLLLSSFLLGIYSLSDYLLHASGSYTLGSALNLNGIFFDHFFSLLIVSDVLILLLSLFYTDDYALIMRNSSFVISTILLKLSFSAEGIFAQLLILIGVAFGVGMYYISQKFQKLQTKA